MNLQDWLNTHISDSARDMPVQVAWRSYSADDLPQDIEQVRQLCADGCPYYNQNGGCPPWSPTIVELGMETNVTLLAVSAKANSEHSMSELNDVLDAWMDQLGYVVLDDLGMSFLSAGPCRACETCTIETGCERPERRVSSITGVGLLLSDILKHHFQQPLQWSKGDQQSERLTKVMGFLHRPEQVEALDQFMKQYIKSK